MKTWKDLSLFQFQQVERINARPDLDELDKVLHTVCIVFGITEHKLNHSTPKKAEALIAKVNTLFSQPFQPKAEKKVGRFVINYDLTSITFGQFIEISFFMHQHIQNAHYILASVASMPGRDVQNSTHKARAEYLQGRSVTEVIGSVGEILHQYQLLIDKFGDLFKNENQSDGMNSPFIKRFGWQYSAEQVMKMTGLNLDQTYNLNIMEALNHLRYLKERANHEELQRKLHKNRL